jgi:hypothetical protein
LLTCKWLIVVSASKARFCIQFFLFCPKLYCNPLLSIVYSSSEKTIFDNFFILWKNGNVCVFCWVIGGFVFFFNVLILFLYRKYILDSSSCSFLLFPFL